MNWEAIGALGEMIGAGAVVTSLVYLAIQIRGRNSEARTAGMHAVSEGFRDSIGSLAEIPHVAKIWIKSNEDPNSLTVQNSLHHNIQQILGNRKPNSLR